MGFRKAGLLGRGLRRLPPTARRLALAAAALVVAGTSTVFDAPSIVSGTAPPTESLPCTDTWTGGAGSGDWARAANWTAGVPGGDGADVCIAGHADVVLTGGPASVAQLSVAAGSSLTIGTGPASGPPAPDGATTEKAPVLSVSSGLQNAGSLTVNASQVAGGPDLTVAGPILNTGTLTVNGTVSLGSSTSPASSASPGNSVSPASPASSAAHAVATVARNDGTVGIAPGGLVAMDDSSSITNEADGLFAFGIDGTPIAPAPVGRITGGTVSLGGSVDPVFEDGFVPPTGTEYVVDNGPFSGTFASIRQGATADYAHAGALGLIGGGPAASTSTTISTSMPTGLQFGHSVALTATVTPMSGSDPTGSVTFLANNVPLGTSPLSTNADGTTSATVDVSSLPVGSAALSARYGGDVVFGPSSAPALTQVVHPDATTLTLTPSPPTPQPGQLVTDTATVALSSPATGTPTGPVSFSDNGNSIAGCAAVALSSTVPLQASCQVSFASGTTHSVVATYAGDGDDASSTASVLQSVGQVATQTTVSSASRALTYGQSVTLTATVAPNGATSVTPTGSATANGSATPTGTVTFYDYQSNPIGTATTATTGDTTTATLELPHLPGGRHAITASYSGDPTFASSTSDPPVDVDVQEAPTTVSVAGSADPIVLGQAVVFTATIGSSVAGETGTVQFADDGIPIGSGTVSGGQATFETGSLALGGHAITAVYEGDDDFVGSSSIDTVALTVDQASTSTVLTADHAPGLVGQTLTFTAAVTPDAPGSGTPTGSVSFSDGATPIPGCEDVALSGTQPPAATCPLVSDTSTQHQVTATFSGDAGFSASTGSMTEAIAPAPTTISVLPSPSVSTAGQSVTLTATVAVTTGAAVPSGMVTFSANGLVLGSSTVTTAGGVASASMLTTALPVGSDAVRASFDGSADFTSSVSTETGVDVGRATTVLGLLSSVNPTVPAQATTLTATVFPSTGSGETGLVTFFADGSRIGASAVVHGQATLTISTLSGGDHAITASYAGDADFIGSATPAPLTQPVGRS